MLLSPVLYITSTCLIQLTTTISFFSRHKISTVAADGDTIFRTHKQNTYPGYSYIFKRNYLSIPSFKRTGLEESYRAHYGRPKVISFLPSTEDRQTQQSITKYPRGYPYHSRVERRKHHLTGFVGSQRDIGSSNRHIFFDAMRLRNSKPHLLSNPFLKHREFSEGVRNLVNTPSFFPRNIYHSRYKSNPSTPNTLNPIKFTMSLLTSSGSLLFASPLRFTKVHHDFGIQKGTPKDAYDSNIQTEDTLLSDLKEEISDRPVVNIHGNYARTMENSLLNIMGKEQETLAKPSPDSIDLIEKFNIRPNDVHEDKSNISSRDEDHIADALGTYLDLSANRKHWNVGEVDTKRLEEDSHKIGTTLDFSGKSRLSKNSYSPTEAGLITNADLPLQVDPSPSYSIDSIKTDYGGIIDDDDGTERQKEKAQEKSEDNKPSFLNILNEVKNYNLRMYANHHNIPDKEYFPPSPQIDPFQTLPESDPFQTLPKSDPFQTLAESDPFQTLPESDPFQTLPKSDPFQTLAESDPFQTLPESDPFQTLPKSDPVQTLPESDPFQTLPESDPFQTLPRKDTDARLAVTSFPPNLEFGKPQYPEWGSFDSDTRDCENIETKKCSANNECTCLGLYFCTEGRCHTIPPPAQDQEERNTGRMIWHEPVSFERK
ncbi:hypothetical protein ACJMK2_015573 [Sinanodonta woodiana]|uniref:Uncharacterized protein n=1 Tax=Sinanodonta woodiana TaxID=1069815 RepID=A0ABD3UTQ9_SINWO